jgi:hypothetical protein
VTVAAPRVLDVCCGGRMFWIDKQNPDAMFVDRRHVPRRVIWSKGPDSRSFEVTPNARMDFRSLAIRDEAFQVVVFDPPHLRVRNGKTGWMQVKYGSLGEDWKTDLRLGFAECFRVLVPGGTLVFRWSSTEIPLRAVLALAGREPLFGQRAGTGATTHWVTFIK